MSQQPGFVPIDFRLAGSVLLGLGILCLAAYAGSQLAGWFPAPSLIGPLGIALTLIGLYVRWASRHK